MSSGIEPIPIPGTGDLIMADAVLKEAFRQGWLSSRHWPNHPLPKALVARIGSTESGDVLLEIEWP